MFEMKNRGWVAPLTDLLLLLAALKTGFLLFPAERPEMGMLGTALVVQLFLGPRGERFAGNAAISATLIFLVYALYWQRFRDAWPLVPWMALLPTWRLICGRPLALSGWLLRVEQRGRACWPQFVGLWQRVEAKPVVAYLRVAGLALIGLGLMWPYLTRGMGGAGDSRWYVSTVADYVVQMRAGSFPLWTAQSDYSFYGGIFPLRMAPYLAHLAGLLDLMTAGQLPPYALMNAALIVSFLGGVLSMYCCLRSVAPGRSWSTLGLALCYGLCPGALGLAYGQDLYMSFCTLPFLPVAFLGVVRSFTRNDLGSRLLMSGGVAAAWLAHPPIGMWCALVIAVTQVGRLLVRASWRSTWKYDAIAAGLFVLLTGYTFVSVKSLGAIWSVDAPASNHYLFITRSFPGNWLPLDPVARGLNDIQLGYGLAAIGLLVAFFARGPEHRLTRLLLGCAAGLVILLLPIPFFTEYLWRALPQAVLNITNIWPMQRLVVLTAVAIAFGAACWLQGFRGNSRAIGFFHLALVGALAWGGLETGKFIRVANTTAAGWEKTATLFRTENRIMTHSALGPHFVRPRYFHHGVTDVQLEHRFLSRDGKEIIRNATDAILPGFGPGTGGEARKLTQQFTGQLDANPGILNLDPAFTLEPGKHYLLALEFLDHDYTGVLLIEGREFSRIYALPSAGEERAFGAGRTHARWLALWQTTGKPEEVRLRWVPGNGAKPESYVPFANFELREYDPAALDVVLESLVPYRAKVKAPAASYLETPRLAYPGYSARVDGRDVAVTTSPDGFVMVPLEAGSHVVELVYTAPMAARLAYWISFAGWIGFVVFAVRYFRKNAGTSLATS